MKADEETHAPKAGQEVAICDESIKVERDPLNWKPTIEYNPTCPECLRGVEAMRKFLED